MASISIVYDSRTGTTAAAAEAMSKTLEDNGHRCSVAAIADADPEQVSQADIVGVGSWTQGLFVIWQHPTKQAMEFIDRLGALTGKRAFVFCTYKLATGSLLPTMANSLEHKGAEVIDEFKFRGPIPNDSFINFAAALD